MLVPIPIACFVGALLTDLMYWRTAAMQWANFSAWLVTVGVIVGWVAAIVGLIDFLGNRFVRAQPPAWPHFIGNAVALTVATFNMLIHSRDAWTCCARVTLEVKFEQRDMGKSLARIQPLNARHKRLPCVASSLSATSCTPSPM